MGPNRLPLHIRVIPAQTAREVAEERHYMRRKPMVSWAFGLHLDDELMGIATFGTPASRHMQQGVCPSDPSMVIELNRVWLSDELPRNSESWFLSRALKLMPPYIVVSYADTTVGHIGHMYRALNFRYAGWTDMERRTPRLDYIPADPSVHSRDASRNGYAATVRRRPKVRYWTVTGDRWERRELEALCHWPSYDWRRLPPPLEHRQLKPSEASFALTT